MRARELLLDLGVAQDAAGGGIDGDHLAGAEAAFFHDGVVVEDDGADFRAERDDAVVGDLVARGAQAVAVEAGADGHAIGEDEAGGAVPRLIEAAVVLVEGLQLGRHAFLGAPRGRHEHGHGVEHAAAAHHERLEGVIELGGIASRRAG